MIAKRRFGRTGLESSVLAFGGGAAFVVILGAILSFGILMKAPRPQQALRGHLAGLSPECLVAVA